MAERYLLPNYLQPILWPDIVDLIKQQYPHWSNEGYICAEDLNHFRHEYIRSLMADERGDLSHLENEVLNSISRKEILTTDVEEVLESKLTIGQLMSDWLAKFGGSWLFIVIFGFLLALWIIVNTVALLSKPFDPYPYILLNLVLSCMAAIQAPIIMMSQNRQEAKDRARSTHDYQINLKAELEIRQIHQKLDHLLSHQLERMMKIQEVQLKFLGEMQALSEQVKTTE